MPKGIYFIETYGCQMNVHDSEIMASLLEESGFAPTSNEKEADIILVNTCAIREKSQHKVYSALGRFRNQKRNNSDTMLIVAGCVAQQEKDELLKATDLVDLVIGTHQISELPTLIARIRNYRNRISKTDFSEDVKSLNLRGLPPHKNQVCSFVTIMQGCSNFCSYCVVPYTRGPEQSRPSNEIIHEIKWLVENGIKEVTLLGQNVNAYGLDLTKDRPTFASLLKAIDDISGLERIRFTTSHPKDFDDELIEAMASLDKVCEHVHLPIQSGSDSILRAMGRKYTRKEYLSTVEALRNRIPEVAITTDIIVGFPGENEENFEDTVSALNIVKYDQIFSFKYSVRPGTAAELFGGHLTEEIKGMRLETVHQIQDRITDQYHRSMEGQTVEVLVEKNPSGPHRQAFGRTRTNKIVNFSTENRDLLGKVVKVKISEGLKHSLRGHEF